MIAGRLIYASMSACSHTNVQPVKLTKNETGYVNRTNKFKQRNSAPEHIFEKTHKQL